MCTSPAQTRLTTPSCGVRQVLTAIAAGTEHAPSRQTHHVRAGTSDRRDRPARLHGRELDVQARNVVTMITNNAAFNCNAAHVIITSSSLAAARAVLRCCRSDLRDDSAAQGLTTLARGPHAMLTAGPNRSSLRRAAATASSPWALVRGRRFAGHTRPCVPHGAILRARVRTGRCPSQARRVPRPSHTLHQRHSLGHTQRVPDHPAVAGADTHQGTLDRRSSNFDTAPSGLITGQRRLWRDQPALGRLSAHADRHPERPRLGAQHLHAGRHRQIGHSRRFARGPHRSGSPTTTVDTSDHDRDSRRPRGGSARTSVEALGG